MGFSRQEYWSRYPFTSPGYLHDPEIELRPPKYQADSLPSEPLGKRDILVMGYTGDILVNSKVKKWKLVTQLCPTLCDLMDYSPPDSSVHGILQARILEWVAIFFSRTSSWPRDQTQVSCISGRLFTDWANGNTK